MHDTSTWRVGILVLAFTATAWAGNPSATELLDADGAPSDLFGRSVARDGDVIVVTAPGDDGVAGALGSATVFRRDGSAWVEEATLVSSAPGPSGLFSTDFGFSVDIDGDVIAVGSRDYAGGPSSAGAVSVFRHDGAGWVEEAFLTGTAPQERLGWNLEVDGDQLFVEAEGADVIRHYRWNGADWVAGQTLAPGGPVACDGDRLAIMSGQIIEMYDEIGGVWTASATLPLPNFGGDIDLDGDVVVTGNILAAGPSGIASGDAVVFRFDGATWGTGQVLEPAGGQAGDSFGSDVAVDGDTLVVGAFRDDVGGAINGGTVRVYRWSGSTWVETQTLAAPTPSTNGFLGREVDLEGEEVLAGAPGQLVAGTSTGAAYLFDLSPGPWTNLGGGTAGSAGAPDLFAAGTLQAGAPTLVALRNAPPGALLLAWISFAPTPFPALGGTVHAFPFANQFLLSASPEGTYETTVAWPAGVPPATSFQLQLLVQDAATLHGITLSNGLLGVAP